MYIFYRRFPVVPYEHVTHAIRHEKVCYPEAYRNQTTHSKSNIVREVGGIDHEGREHCDDLHHKKDLQEPQHVPRSYNDEHRADGNHKGEDHNSGNGRDHNPVMGRSMAGEILWHVDLEILKKDENGQHRTRIELPVEEKQPPAKCASLAHVTDNAGNDTDRKNGKEVTIAGDVQGEMARRS